MDKAILITGAVLIGFTGWYFTTQSGCSKASEFNGQRDYCEMQVEKYGEEGANGALSYFKAGASASGYDSHEALYKKGYRLTKKVYQEVREWGV